MMDKEEYDKAFYAFYEAIINERHWDSLRLPRDIAFYRFCFNEAVAGRMTGGRLEVRAYSLQNYFYLAINRQPASKSYSALSAPPMMIVNSFI